MLVKMFISPNAGLSIPKYQLDRKPARKRHLVDLNLVTIISHPFPHLITPSVFVTPYVSSSPARQLYDPAALSLVVYTFPGKCFLPILR